MKNQTDETEDLLDKLLVKFEESFPYLSNLFLSY